MSARRGSTIRRSQSGCSKSAINHPATRRKVKMSAYNFKDFDAQFPDDAACLDFIFRARYAGHTCEYLDALKLLEQSGGK